MGTLTVAPAYDLPAIVLSEVLKRGKINPAGYCAQGVIEGERA